MLSEIGNLICLKHLFTLFYFQKLHLFIHACATCSELPFNVSIINLSVLFVLSIFHYFINLKRTTEILKPTKAIKSETECAQKPVGT